MQIATIKTITELNQYTKYKILIFKFLFISLLSIWISGLLMPFIIDIKNPLLSYLINKIYSTVCHQENFKCISYEGHRMFVCARCTGIYFGAFIAAIVELRFIFPELPLKLLFLSSTPLLLDVIFSTTGVYEYSQIFAFITGIIFGFVIYLFIIKELENFIANN
ncbi:MAG: DUF2085 domain-containing protein [Ignavibacteriaceae bacterium]